MNVLCFNKAGKLETLINAVDASKCVAIGFNGDENADQIRAMFAASGVTSIENLGLVQHGDITIQLGSVSLHLNSDKSGASTDDSSFSNLLDSLCKKYNISNVDIIACNMLSLWTDKLKELEQQVDANIRASNDATGNLKSGGNWIQESDDVNIAGIYFDKDKLKDYEELLFSYGYDDKRRTYQPYFDVDGQRVSIFSTAGAFAALDEDGKVHTWGEADYGGNLTDEIPYGKTIKTIFNNRRTFAAIDSTGKVYAWGASWGSGTIPSITKNLMNTKTIKTIFSTDFALAALDEDGKVYAWGPTDQGGTIPSDMNTKTIKTIFSAQSAFAALDSSGQVHTWGSSGWGGSISPLSKSEMTGKTIKTIFSTYGAFAALDSNGKVYAWGDVLLGGGLPPELHTLFAQKSQTNKIIKTIFSTNEAFAALDEDGKVYTWGNPTWGGDSGSVLDNKTIKTIFSTERAFAALDEDGKVYTWGNALFGGNLTNEIPSGKTITTIFSTNSAFAALDSSGKVYAWPPSAGTIPSDMNTKTIKTIFSTQKAFAALDSNGQVYAWGDPAPSEGGELEAGAKKDARAQSVALWGGTIPTVTKNLMDVTTIKTIFSTEHAFAALDEDGQIYTWGDSVFGNSTTNILDDDISTVTLGNVKFDLAHKNLDTRNVVVELTNSLENNDFSYSSFVDTDLTGVNLTGAITGPIVGIPAQLPIGYILDNGYIVFDSFVNANLTNANYTNNIFAGKDLTNADLTNSTLTNVNFQGTTLTSVTWIGVKSSGIVGTPSAGTLGSYKIIKGHIVGPNVDLTNVDLTNANLTGVDLSGATLTNVKLSSELGGHWLFKHLTEAQRRQVKIDNENKTNVQMMAIDNVYEFKVVGRRRLRTRDVF